MLSIKLPVSWMAGSRLASVPIMSDDDFYGHFASDSRVHNHIRRIDSG